MNGILSSAQNFTTKKYLHAALLFAGLMFLLVKDFPDSLGCCGIALAFAPFNQSVKFVNWPLWQKAWLIEQLTVVFVLL
jgi:hypothetical protein